MSHRTHNAEKEVAETRFVMTVALLTGAVLIGIKAAAYILTNSSAVLGDAVESLSHIIATAFAFSALLLSYRPADRSHLYGHSKISFLSQAVEGGMVLLAAVVILGNSLMDFLRGPQLRNLDWGTGLSALAAILNLALGLSLHTIGKRHNAIVVQSHAQHVLTDVWTTLAALGGLFLVKLTGWSYFDPLCAAAIAIVVTKTGWGLVRSSLSGLLDEAHPQTQSTLEKLLTAETAKRGGSYHQLRHRQLGNAWAVEYHLLLPGKLTLEEAHRAACEIEKIIQDKLGVRTDIVTHLEAIESHDELHPPQ